MKTKTLNEKVLNELLEAVDQMVLRIQWVINEDDADEQYEKVVDAVSHFLNKCEGSYEQSGTDGFFARLGK